jgi:hypothetical protein
MQIGLRGLGRRRRRSLATAVIVALAVGNLLAVRLAAAATGELARVLGQPPRGPAPVDEADATSSTRVRCARSRRRRVSPRAQPALVSDAEARGEEAFV